MSVRWLFLAAYLCSGLAGLIYQLSWTRLLTLHMGHTTAAVSTVVAAFMGGLAAGAALGGRIAPRLAPRQSLHAYILLECLVGLAALIVPFGLAALTPILAWSYQNGTPGVLFPAIRLFSCLVVILIPATALGATFPIAVRWFVGELDRIGRRGGELYAANTAGAAIGAVAAGFLLIPTIGISGTTLVGVSASALAVAAVFGVARQVRDAAHVQTTGVNPGAASGDIEKRAKQRVKRPAGRAPAPMPEARWLAAVVLGLSGFATLMYEIAWTRVFSLIIGPTTYAIAATLAVLIAGLAFGSALGSSLAGRARRPAVWLALALVAAALAVSWASWLAGGYLPRLVAHQAAQSSEAFNQLMMRQVILAAALVLPAATALGVAFPLALELISGHEQPVPRRVGFVYAINTLAAVAGALAAGFVSIPQYGLQNTLGLVSALLVVAALVVIAWGRLSPKVRIVGLIPAAAAAGLLLLSPPWDRDLLASGAYKQIAGAEDDLDLEAILKAGELLYYRDGAASTVSVKRIAGVLSLAIDGKVDASNSGDLLTQKALAHLPLLLHPNPREVGIIGLGSGATLGSALLHPITRADVVEISPQVVEASRYFSAENHDALSDPRTHLILGDGRSHLLLSSRQYDVIISEPSNPWMAGVAALFTREFFAAARSRLAPGGIICQWAHTYSISDSDLRSIAATFASVFPDGTMWLVGEGDLLLVASTGPLDSQLVNLERGWQSPGIAADLGAVAAVEPFALWSLFVGGPQELSRYASGAALQTDDRMALEFSGPRALGSAGAGIDNASTLRRLLDDRGGPPAIRRAKATAGAAQWRNRGAMMRKANDYATAYQDYAKAVTLDPADAAALDGLVETSVAMHQEAPTIALLKSLIRADPRTPDILIAVSRLLAASGSFDEAIVAAREASLVGPADARAWEQLASIFADLEDVGQLDPVVERLLQQQPRSAGSRYYAAGARFLHGKYAEALSLAQQAIAADPQYTPAYKLLGAILTALDQPQAAREAFQTALRLNPRDSTTHTNLGLLELMSANAASASNYFAVALTLDPTSAMARQGLARARQGAFE